jgi:hypothetical protein
VHRCATCADCDAVHKVKAHASRSFRTLFGTYKLYSPRLEHCDCTRRKTSSFRPLSALLTESVAPELLYMEAKWSSLVSYGMSLEALKDFLPLDVTLDAKTVRYDTLKVAKRLEAELGDEQQRFIVSNWEGQNPRLYRASGFRLLSLQASTWSPARCTSGLRSDATRADCAPGPLMLTPCGHA